MESYIVETQKRIDRLFVNPDPVDPYTFDGISYAPVVMDRVMRTPSDVVTVIAQAKAVRRMSTEDVIAASNISREEIVELEQSGTGKTASLLSVMEALGVNPITIPGLTV